MAYRYQHRRHNKNLLMVHFIFVTKYRKKLLYGDFKNDIKQWIYETCIEHHRYIKKMETDKDHIHILIQYNPKDSIIDIVSALKQKTTYLSWNNYSSMLHKYYWNKNILWSHSYFACSIGQVYQNIIEKYIQN